MGETKLQTKRRPSIDLTSRDIHVWRIDAALMAATDPVDLDGLSPDERRRALRMHPRARLCWAASRRALRAILALYAGRDAGTLTFVHGPNGKPALAPQPGMPVVAFSLSYSGSVTLCAVARRPVGIDVEQRAVFDHIAVAKAFFAAGEIQELSSTPAKHVADAFFRCWTRKEALVKAAGAGLAMPLNAFTVPCGHASSASVRLSDAAGQKATWRIRDIPVGPDRFAAVAYQGRGMRLKLLQWLDTVAAPAAAPADHPTLFAAEGRS